MPQDTADKRQVHRSFGVGMGIAALILAFLALSSMFGLGVLVGRGYNPEDNVPALAKIMPSAEKNAADKTAQSAIIPSEELDVLQNLRNAKTATIKTEQRSEKSTAVASAQNTERPKSPSVSTKKNTKNAQTQNAVQAALASLGASQADDNSNAVYTFTYQVASVKQEAQAENFTLKLRNKGFAASMEKVNTEKGVWHRIYVSVTGSDKDALALKERLAQQGMAQVFLKQKVLR